MQSIVRKNQITVLNNRITLAHVNSFSRSLYVVVRPSVVCLSVSLYVCDVCAPYSAMFLSHLVPWPSIDIHRKCYADRPRGTPPSMGVNARGVAKYSDFGPIEGYISATVQDRRYRKLVTNRKSYMSSRFVPKSVTLNDL